MRWVGHSNKCLKCSYSRWARKPEYMFLQSKELGPDANIKIENF